MAGAVEERYRGDAGAKYQREKRAVPALATPWVETLRAEKLQPYVRDGDVVFEFGAGLGWNLAQLKCARRLATDLEDFLSPELKLSGVEFAACVENFGPETIDAVICHHVLEHVENPPAMLRDALRLLRPGGRLLAFVPYEKESRYRHYDPAEPNHHLYSWNVQTFANLIAAVGFEVSEAHIGEFGYDRFAAKIATRFGLGESAFRMFRRLAHLLGPGREVRVIATKPSQPRCGVRP